MRLALLSNVTVEVLAGMLKKEHSIWMPPGFGAWMETALNPPPGLKEFNPEVIFLILDSSHAVFDDAECKMAKAKLDAAFPLATTLTLDMEDLANDVSGFYDERMWRLGSMPWSMKGLRAIKDEINRLIGMMRGGRKKVLAVDFDNTLWAGVIGEDGVQGVRPYESFQTGLKDLLRGGVLLAGLSKNNVEDVEPIWNDSRMVLKRDDFVALRVDWKDKAGNLADVAKELNLGIDSFVFVDDNPAEREATKAVLPEVAVPEFPEDEHAQPRFLRHIKRMYFPDMRMTEEDWKKTVQYQEEAERRKFAASLSVEDYLKGLEIWADIHQVREQEIPRVAQLSQKTNQFNVLTNRYSIDEVVRFANDTSRLLLTVHAGDRFGDQGLVAFVQAVIDGDTATITDWVMSCRTMNRRLEFAVEEQLEKCLTGRDVATICASWCRTLKNAPVSGLFESFGFEVLAADEAEKRYVLKLPRKVELVHQVKIKGE